MGYKISADSNLENLYIDDPYLIEQFAGDRLWSWGRDNYGQLGDNTNNNSKSSPVQTIAGGTNWKQVSSCGYSHNAAIKTDGTLWLWGYNGWGQLGDNTLSHKSSPVQTVAGGINWKQISCAKYSSAAIKTDGTLWTWGNGNFGFIGDNNRANKSSPVQTITGGTNWKQVSACGYNVTAIKTDGTLWCWGYNANGQLGDNTIAPKSSPIQTIAGGTNWKQVSCGNLHIAAIKLDGTLWTWGDGANGKLGSNSTAARSSPVQTITGGSDWKQVSAGYYHTAAIKLDGTLWCWGYNANGQLGDNTATDRLSPVQTIVGGTNWKQVACGYKITTAIKTDGTLWSWGYNNYGQLGDNTSVDKSSPVQTIAGGNNWKQTLSGFNSISAISINNINTTGAE